MKIKINLIFCSLLLVSAAGFSQKKPAREYVSDIPAGRDILVQPMLGTEKAPFKGKVTINFTLDKRGNVVAAVADRKGATVKDKEFIHKYEEAVKHAKFSEMKKGPETQHGSLTYTF